MIGSLLNAHAAKPAEKLIVLGATGSVGTTALNFLEKNREIKLSAISIHSSVHKLHEIFSRFDVRNVAITDESVYDSSIEKLKRNFSHVSYFRGESGVLEMIESSDADTVLTAVVGASGIRATMTSLRLGKKIALANKETMVTAGPAICEFIKNASVKPVIIPVDSEHNALFQLIHGISENHIERMILTASGGPFRDMTPEEIQKVTLKEVLDHPTWNMGPKITVDSAGMINKGLEIIEAHHLFSIPYDMLDVLVHKRSYIHAMVKTRDGGFLMAGSSPDMVFPIAHALLFPEPVKKTHDAASDPDTWPSLEFQKVDRARYPGFSLALAAGGAGGTAPAIFNASNEIAVGRFLAGNIEFTDIPRLIEMVMEKIPVEYGTDLELFTDADLRARNLTEDQVSILMR